MGLAAASYEDDVAAVEVAEGDSYPHADHAVDSDHLPLGLEEALGPVAGDETDVAGTVVAVAVAAALPLDGVAVVAAASGRIGFERTVDEAVVAAHQVDGIRSQDDHTRPIHPIHAHRDAHVASDPACGLARSYCTCSVGVL